MRCLHVRLLVALLLFVPLPASAAPDLDISYTLSSPEPATHLYSVRMRVAGVAGRDHVDLAMPVWTPGSYLVREFDRLVQDFTAAPARWRKVDKTTWRVWPTGDVLEVTYRVYAYEQSVRTSFLDEARGYVNPASVLMYVAGAVDRPVTLTLEPPRGWDAATSLDLVSHADNRFVFTAPDYDRLVDSPILSGTFRRIEFEAAGRPHTIAIFGAGNYDPTRLAADVKKIVETSAAIFGGKAPYERYVFILHLLPDGGGGLEHLSSTSIEATPFAFQKKESYRGFLGLVAHEHFHAWNVKRIRPVPLGPFDYSAENYSRMLWLMEGGTDFYASLVLRRAGLMTEEDYNKELAKALQSLDGIPGRRHLSLEDASFDAWIRHYRQNEHSINSQVSYYLKGSIVCAMLDLEIRGRTKGAKSLDDVMRYLWETYAQKGVGVPEDGVQPAVEAIAGSSFADFFDKYVRGTVDIEYNAFLKHAELELKTEVKKDDTRIDPSKLGAWLGANLADTNGQTVVRTVLEDSPAWKAGLNVNDEVLALDNYRVSAATLNDRLADLAPGGHVTLTIFRRGELKALRVTLGSRPPDTYKIEKIAPAKK